MKQLKNVSELNSLLQKYEEIGLEFSAERLKEEGYNPSFAGVDLTLIIKKYPQIVNVEGISWKDAVIITEPDHSINLSEKQKKDAIILEIDPNLAFKQNLLTGQNSYLNQGGVCNGLCIDYTRRLLKNKHDNGYIEKLNRKIKKASNNFIRRIQSYQDNLQTHLNLDANKEIVSLDLLKSGKFLDSVPETHINSRSIGLVVRNEESGHIITVAKVENGYRIFDFNYGEIRIEGQNEEENKKQLNLQIATIGRLYSAKGNYTECAIVDLEAVVKQSELIGPDKYFKVATLNRTDSLN